MPRSLAALLVAIGGAGCYHLPATHPSVAGDALLRDGEASDVRSWQAAAYSWSRVRTDGERIDSEDVRVSLGWVRLRRDEKISTGLHVDATWFLLPTFVTDSVPPSITVGPGVHWSHRQLTWGGTLDVGYAATGVRPGAFAIGPRAFVAWDFGRIGSTGGGSTADLFVQAEAAALTPGLYRGAVMFGVRLVSPRASPPRAP